MLKKEKSSSRSSDECGNAIDLDQFGEDEIAADLKRTQCIFPKISHGFKCVL